MQNVIPYSTDGGIAKLSCNGVSLTRDGEWLLPIWREIGGGAPCQSVPKSAKALHGVAGVLRSSDQVQLHCAPVEQRNIAIKLFERCLSRMRNSHDYLLSSCC